jgi:pimeloyl-ACP methyl ester carboxylesterase
MTHVPDDAPAARLTSYENDGFTFDVRDEGPLDGLPVVLLHGFPDGPASWDRVVPLLTAAGLRVLVPAQRGYSPRARPPQRSAYRLDTLARDVLALADAAGLETFHVVGHDWGGGVAWQLGIAHGRRLRTLTVASTPHPRAMVAAMTHSTQALRSWYMAVFQIPRFAEWNLHLRGGELFARNLEKGGLPKAEAEAAVRLLQEPGAATGALNWYRGIQVGGLKTAAAVAVPTLYVWSTDDVALGRYAAEHTADWVSGPYRYEVLPGVSHWIPTEAADRMAELILEQVASVA